jgi:hypothetical protein
MFTGILPMDMIKRLLSSVKDIGADKKGKAKEKTLSTQSDLT